MTEWQPIETAPKDGSWIIGRRGHLKRATSWGKTSHVPLYGWCYIATKFPGVEPDLDLWEPLEWHPKRYT